MADVDQTTPKLQSNPKGGRRRRNKEDETGADGISPKKEESTTSTAGPTKKNGWGEDAKAPMEAKEIAAPTMKDDPIAADEDQSMIPSLDGEKITHMFGSPWRTNYRGMTFTVRSLSRVLRGLSCPASIIVQPCSMRIRYRGSPSKSLFCEVLRSFSHSEGTTNYFPIPRRKTVPWSLKHGVSIQVCFLRDAAIIFAFRRRYTLFSNTSKGDCIVVAKTSSVHPGLFFAIGCDHFRIPKPVHFIF